MTNRGVHLQDKPSRSVLRREPLSLILFLSWRRSRSAGDAAIHALPLVALNCSWIATPIPQQRDGLAMTKRAKPRPTLQKLGVNWPDGLERRE